MRNFLAFISFVVLSLVLSTCNVGLGSEVDINAPALEITYPETMSVARGEIKLEGTVSDDSGVSSVEVFLYKKSDKENQLIDLSSNSKKNRATVDSKNKKWVYTLENLKESSGWTYKDGEYVLKVKANDIAGRSTETQTSFYIDNTVPFVLLDRPSTKGEADPDPYGMNLTFSGSIYDAHDCSKMLIDFYRLNESGSLEKIEGATYLKENINQNFEFNIPENVFDKLKESIPEGDDKYKEYKLYYTLTVYDSAFSYSGSGTNAETTEGNYTTHYYLYDDVSQLLEIGKQLPARSELSEFDAAIDFNEASSRANITDTGITSTELQKLRISTTAEAVSPQTSGCFSINPYNKNPSVKISAFEWERGSLSSTNTKREECFAKNIAPGNSTVAITLSPGPDRVSIDRSKIYVYMVDTLPVKLGEPPASSLIPQDKINNSGTDLIVNYKIEKKRNPETKEGWYLIVDAIDKSGYTTTHRDDESYGYTGDVGYGIYAISINGNAPDFTENEVEPADKIKIRPDNNDGTVAVTITAEDYDSKAIELFIRNSDENNFTEITSNSAYWGNASTYYSKPIGDKGYSFKWETKLPVSLTDGNKVTYEFYVNDGLYESNTVTRTWTIDTHVPEILSLSKPAILEENFSGTVASNFEDYLVTSTSVQFRGVSAVDLETALFKVVPFETDTLEGAVPSLQDTDWSIAEVIGLALENKTFNIHLTMKDASGNPSEGRYTVWYALADDTGAYSEVQKFGTFVVDLNGPKLDVTEPTDDYSKDAGSFTIAGTAEDSFGLKSLEIYETVPGGSEEKVVDIDFVNGTIPEENWSWNNGSNVKGRWQHTVLNPAGNYTYRIVLTDLALRPEVAVKRIFADSTPPECTITNLQDNSWINAPSYEIRMSATDGPNSAGIKNVKYKLDGGDWIEANVLGSSGTYVAPVSNLVSGNTHTLVVCATDNALNENMLETVHFGVDTVPPVVSLFKIDTYDMTSNAMSIVRVEDWDISITVSDAASGIKSIRLLENGNEITNGITIDGGNVSFHKNLGDATGTFSYSLSVIDNAGNETQLKGREVNVTADFPVVTFEKINGVVHDGSTTAYAPDTAVITGYVNKEVEYLKYKLYWNNGTTTLEDEEWRNDAVVSETPDERGYFPWTITYTNNSSVKLMGIYFNARDTLGHNSSGVSTRHAMSMVLDKINPVVTLTVPASSGVFLPVTAGENIVLKGTALDEGLAGVKKLEISLNGGTSWTEIDIARNWSYEIQKSSLTGGAAYNLKARITDSADNSSVTGTVSFTADFETPNLTASCPVDATNALFTISGKAWDGDGLSSITITDDFAGEQATKTWTNAAFTTVNLNAKTDPLSDNWSKTFTVGNSGEIKDGVHNFKIVAQDIAGRRVQSNVTVMVDTTNPVTDAEPIFETVYAQSGNEKWYKSSSVKISTFNVTDVNISEVVATYCLASDYVNSVMNNSQEIILKRNGTNWTGSIPFEGSRNKLKITATDTVGNSASTAVLDILIDTTVPEIALDDDSVISVNGAFMLSGTASDSESGLAATNPVMISGAGQNIAADYNAQTGKWTKTITAQADGKYTFTITATDKVGRTETVKKVVNVDTDKPAVTISSPVSVANAATGVAANQNNSITITGSSNDETSQIVSVKIYKSLDGSSYAETPVYTAVSPYSWSYVYDSTADYALTGNVYLKAIATDEAGNVSAGTIIKAEIDQNADRPVIKLTNMDPVYSANDANISVVKMSSTIYGSITDDDGTVKNVQVSQDGGVTWIQSGTKYLWNANTNKYETSNDQNAIVVLNVSSGVFNYTIGGLDGTKNLMFKVTDATDVVFTSKDASSALVRPYLTGNNDVKTDALSEVYVKVDTLLPEFGQDLTITAYTDSTGSAVVADSAVLLTNSSKLGAKYRYFKISGTASDANGILSVTCKCDETGYTTTLNGNAFTTELIDFGSEAASATKTITLEVRDNSDLRGNTSRSFLYDAAVPTIDFNNPQNGERIIGGITMNGSASDPEPSSGLSSVKYYIPTKEEAATFDATKVTWLETEGSAYGWSIDFTEFADNKYELDNYANATYGTEVDVDGYVHSNIWLIPVYFRVEDSAHNVLVKTDYAIEVNPDGDKPTASLTYPTSGDVLGGMVRVAGTAEDNTRVGEVYIQIDTDNDGFDADDKSALLSAGYTIRDFAATANEEAWWGIKATGTSSWGININEQGELYGTGTQVVCVRSRAIDENGKVGLWDNVSGTSFTFNNKAPKIASLTLVQYENNTNGTGNKEAEIPYTDDMWIKGKWYLVAELASADGTNLKSYSFQKIDTDHVGIEEIHNDIASSTVTARLALDTTNEAVFNGKEFGVQLNITDQATISTTRKIYINYDNEAPSVGTVLHGENPLGTDTANGEEKIIQSNGGFEISAEVTEERSGFDRMYIWFYRDSGGKAKRIYNPATGSRIDFTDASGNAISGMSFRASDGVPVLTKTVARASKTKLSYTGLGSNTDIKVGCMVSIGGADRQITKIEGDVVTISEEVDTSFTSASFILASVIDHVAIETPVFTDGAITSILNDDDDFIPESVEKSGTIYKCAVYIDSKTIADGTITVKYAVYDKSENCQTGSVVSTVENNGPRISKIELGTDLSGNGTVADTASIQEIFEYSVNSSANVEITPDNFKAKGITTIKPEILGGNGNLYYYLKIDGTNAANHQKVQIRTGNNGEVSAANLAVAVMSAYDDRTVPFLFTVWDSTEEGTVGSTTQSAVATITIPVDVIDKVAPSNVVITQFNAENYASFISGGNNDNGHIDIAATPNVSGKVVIRGTSFDDVRLGKLQMKIDQYNMGNSASGTATSTADAALVTCATYNPAEANWTINVTGFAVDSDVLTQDGHTVSWSYEWDTQCIKNVAKAGVNLNFTAVDASADDANDPNNDTDSTAATPYTVNVAPYIKDVKRNDSFNTLIARSGAYALLRDEEENIITGFNLAGASGVTLTSDKDGTADSVAMTSVANTGTDDKAVSFTVASNAKDGYLTVTVNGVKSTNNTNAYIATNTVTTTKLFDRTELTDDVYVHIWRVNKQDTFKGSNNCVYPAMSKNATNNKLYASFTNYGQSKSYFTDSFTGDTAVTVSSDKGPAANNNITTVYYGYDPSEDTDISVDSNGGVNVFFNANYHGGQAYSFGNGTNGVAWNDSAPRNAGGLYVYDTAATATTYNTNNGVAHNFYRFELFTYDDELNQFKNTRVLRTYVNSTAYTNIVYYDRLNSSIKFSYATGGTDTSQYGLSWVVIDGTPDVTDTSRLVPNHQTGSNNTFTFAGGWNPFILTDARYEKDEKDKPIRTTGTGESVSLTATTGGLPVVLYMDAQTNQLRIAIANSRAPKTADNWKVQKVFTDTNDPNYATASDYLVCAIDSSNYLHIAFQNIKGQLVYAKSDNNPTNGTTAYTFNDGSQVLDDSGIWIDITMDGTTPYISYLSKINSYDGMKLAYYDTTLDLNNDGTADGGWETMTAPLNAKVTNVRSCIEVNAKAFDANTYKAAIGFCPGSDYRAAFYVGK